MTKVITQEDLDFSDIVQMTAYAIARGEESYSSVPGLIAKIIRNKSWIHRGAAVSHIKNHQTVWRERGDNWRLDEFETFITAPFPYGMNTTLSRLLALCVDDSKAIEMIQQTTGNRSALHLSINGDNLTEAAQLIAAYLTPDEIKRFTDELMKSSQNT